MDDPFKTCDDGPVFLDHKTLEAKAAPPIDMPPKQPELSLPPQFRPSQLHDLSPWEYLHNTQEELLAVLCTSLTWRGRLRGSCLLILSDPMSAKENVQKGTARVRTQR